MKKYGVILGLAIIIVIVGALITYGPQVATSPSPSPETVNEEGQTSQESPLIVEDESENSVAVTSAPPGEVVTVLFARLSQEGYVVIHEDRDGNPGEVIGFSELLSEGRTENIEIELDREVEDGEVLYAMLHEDDGDGEYGFPDSDPPVMDAEGNVVLMRFVVGAEY